MEILTKPESTPEEVMLEVPFQFKVEGYQFTIKPLTMYDYYQTEKMIHRSLAALYYYGINIDQGWREGFRGGFFGFQRYNLLRRGPLGRGEFDVAPGPVPASMYPQPHGDQDHQRKKDPLFAACYSCKHIITIQS